MAEPGTVRTRRHRGPDARAGPGDRWRRLAVGQADGDTDRGHPAARPAHSHRRHGARAARRGTPVLSGRGGAAATAPGLRARPRRAARGLVGAPAAGARHAHHSPRGDAERVGDSAGPGPARGMAGRSVPGHSGRGLGAARAGPGATGRDAPPRAQPLTHQRRRPAERRSPASTSSRGTSSPAGAGARTPRRA